MTDRPQIPKRLAARLRAAYTNAERQRDRLAHAEARIEDFRARISEFDAGPQRFAELYYGRHTVDSYAVQTTMERTREALAYRQQRMLVYLESVAAAELMKLRVETQVLDELHVMTRETPGRVAWPPEPKSLDTLRVASLEAYRSARTDYEAHAVDAERLRREREAEQKAAWEIEFRGIDERMARKFSAMPSGQVAAARAYWEALKSAFSRDCFSLAELFDLANGDEVAHQRILDDARSRLQITSERLAPAASAGFSPTSQSG